MNVSNSNAAPKHVLRSREKASLRDMINMAVPLDANGNPVELTNTSGENSDVPGAWRLLLFDNWGRDVMAPLLRVGDLRELGVTLYMHMDAERDPVPGAPAIYFCAPTMDNIARIVRDCQNELYEWVYLNFTAQVPRTLLEALANGLAEANIASIRHIRVFDRTLNYVALDDDLFSLMLPKSFLLLNQRNVKDAEVEQHLTDIVVGLLHVLLSRQILPVIAHSKTGAAEEVARRLSSRLNDALNERLLVPAPLAMFGRPLLLITDRSIDFAAALHHPFSYRGLLVDVTGMSLNKCTIHANNDKAEVVELDPERDQFYRTNGQQDFGDVGGHMEAALKEYKDECAQLAAESGAVDGAADSEAMSRVLAGAPQRVERKRFLDAHTKLAYYVLGCIRERHLDRFHGVELAMLMREELDQAEMEKLLTNQCGTKEDRQRLCLIAYLMHADRDEKDSAAAFVHKQLQSMGENPFPALKYLKDLRSWAKSAPGGAGKREEGTNEGLGWLAQQIAKNIASTLGSSGETELPITQLVAALLQDGPVGNNSAASPTVSSPTGTSSSAQADRRRWLGTVGAYDPRTKSPVDLMTLKFSEAIVFALGGGSAVEYDDLKEWEAARPRKAVSYGCTALLSGNDLLQQLSQLGSE